MNQTRRGRLGRIVGLLGAAGLCASAFGGGSPENVLIIINPGSAESMYLGHYYQFARNIPASNVLYIDPNAASYTALAGANGNIDAIFGKLTNSKLSDHIDYIVIADATNFFINAPGQVQDICWPVNRFSFTGAYTTAFIRPQILTGVESSQSTNQYFSTSTPRAFDSNINWNQGSPVGVPAAPRYFIVSQLGYTGSLGNTVADITAMIDRSVAADGTRPAGKFYFMSTTDAIRNVRSPSFPASVSAITSAGGQAEIINAVMPDLRNDCLGILTGWADPNVDGSTYTILPGAFCDHLTSWAATFDNVQQTKMSAWIRRGACGTSGAVEEPCNYLGKFPNPNLHVNYFKGLSLGEAWFRSMNYLPFQIMYQGDPLTRTYSTFPSLVGNAPSGTVSGNITFNPTTSTNLPGAAIQGVDLLINGIFQSSQPQGNDFTINTGALPEGPNEIRVLSYDNTTIKNTARWVGTFNVNNLGRSVSLNLAPSTGDMTTKLIGTIGASGPGTIREVHLIQNGRVVASGPDTASTLSVFGRNLGPGKTKVQAEIVYSDFSRALSQPVLVDIAFTAGTPIGQPPIAYSFTKRIARNSPVVVELPALFDDALANATFSLLTNPAQCTVGAGTKSYRIMTANANACGTDSFTYRVNTPSGQSNTATVTLIYDHSPAGCRADFNGDGFLNALDFSAFINGYAAASLQNDYNGDCNLNVLDFSAYLNAFAVGCP